MSDDKFDAIVVGAGVAGSVAALVMARAGLDVLVIERGDSAGCKNMTDGRLYAHTLEAIIPGFAVSAPVERKVTREKISFLTEESAVTLDFHSEQPDVPQHASYTVLRNRLDPWLMEQAEQAGAQFIPGVRVDALVREGNKVTGVQAGDDILEANVVILADGVNSMLGRSLGMVPASDPHHYAVVEAVFFVDVFLVATFSFVVSDFAVAVFLLVAVVDLAAVAFLVVAFLAGAVFTAGADSATITFSLVSFG